VTATPDIRSLVYGPVPSRRLGRSLGVDLVPFKTCTYDCVYCQLGPTTHKTATRERWVEPGLVLDQVRGRLDSRPDVIALAGSGEPTLYAGLGEVIDGIKAMADVPLVVITNGSLLGRPDVQRDLAGADIVLPSLDAVDDASYRAVNRPHEDLGFDELVDGMAAFRASFSGEIWLEVMLLDGVTGTAPMVEKLARHTARIAPDRIQLNTVVRPPAEQDARPVSPEMLEHFATAFTPQAEVIAGAPELNPDQEATAADVLTLISRRPCTVADVAAGLGIHQNTALKALTALVERDEAQRRDHSGGVFYAAANRLLPDVEES
jgi:wyosine [tRNA(Phe)-imidazoG37] synthetase (radical SAM superfamily)